MGVPATPSDHSGNPEPQEGLGHTASVPNADLLHLCCDKCGQHWRYIDRPEDAHALLDAFYGAIPEQFGHCFGDGRHGGAAASVELSDGDLMWLRGIAAAIHANHPLARMTRLDEEMGLYDDDVAVGNADAPK